MAHSVSARPWCKRSRVRFPNLTSLFRLLSVLCSLSSFKDVRANCFCASLLRTQIHTPGHTRARALSNKMRDDRAKGHCYSFAWI